MILADDALSRAAARSIRRDAINQLIGMPTCSLKRCERYAGPTLSHAVARQGALPAAFREVSSVTHTPLVATAAAAALVLGLALLLPLEGLADLSARFTLLLFAIVNWALIRIKAGEREPPRHIYLTPRWVPWAGLASCLALLLLDLGGTITAMVSDPAGLTP